MEPRATHMLGKCPTSELYPCPDLVNLNKKSRESELDELFDDPEEQ
jgi:hypothetical protein